MNFSTDILSLALRQPTLSDQLELAINEDKSNHHYTFSLQRYISSEPLPVDEIGTIIYQPTPDKKNSQVELRYCIEGNRYCNNPACNDHLCALHKQAGEVAAADNFSIDVISIRYSQDMIAGLLENNNTELFKNKHQAFVKTITPLTRTKNTLDQIVHHPYQGTLKNIFLQAKMLDLLLYSTDQYIQTDTEERYGCRFLTNTDDQEKIIRARDILLEHLDSPLTIKELSRKVAMNECYLKKGFKAMYGTTIYDYFQKERMEKARHLLCEKDISVSEVALQMGYSCISHFSTAFKKYTGLKPCELLFH